MSHLKYTIQNSQFEYDGSNIKFNIARRTTNSLLWYKREKWVGKISKTLTPHIYDLNSRALLAYDLATFLEVPMPEIKLIDQADFTNFSKIYNKFPELITQSNKFYDYKKVLICLYKGKPITKNDLKKISITRFLKIFVFDCWIGSFDKKDNEFLIDSNNDLWAIDYQLWGPVGDINMSLGAEAITYLADETSFNYCLGSITKDLLLSSLAQNLDLSILNSIENFPDIVIKELINKYSIFKRGSNVELINGQMFEYLIGRKRIIKEQIMRYFKKNFPANN